MNIKENILLISTLSFVFISFYALNLMEEGEIYIPKIREREEVVVTYNVVPGLINGAVYPDVSADSVYVLDIISGISLYEKTPDKPQLPASTAKIITALVSLDYYPEDLVLEVGNISVDGQKMGLVKGGRG